MWKRFRDLSIKSYEKVYARLNVHFDVYAGESQVSNTLIKEALAILKEKKLLTTKTKDESRPDWDKRRAEMKDVAVVEESLGQDEDAEDVAEGKNGELALAVDLNKWKLGKPVVQKPGTRITETLLK